MNILSNVEFEKLVVDQSPRLKTLAKTRCDQSPNGFLTLDDIGHYTKACMYSGDKKAVQWLKSLVVLAKNGKLTRIRTNATTWEDHVEDIHQRYAAGEVSFDIAQHVRCKDSGRYGSVVDYVVDTKEYIVVLDPFQIQTYKKKELEKVASLKRVADDAFGSQDEIQELDVLVDVLDDPNLRGFACRIPDSKHYRRAPIGSSPDIPSRMEIHQYLEAARMEAARQTNEPFEEVEEVEAAFDVF